MIDDTIERAKAHFFAGNDHFEAGRFDAALLAGWATTAPLGPAAKEPPGVFMVRSKPDLSEV